ncbi:THO complex subunit 2 [Beauveria bassiana ARSEF 2860]|uniref:THO complex subunit 2 n=1 Tax=Beauveria bassiana (strain ARSEF 2860) TaxID=655819 RepID=J5JX22_BEAB2|nr:THO complex subunit 2 [Beauveria bassiana ARSEF 2860]EJP69123.1 THO complex subunit 2 [Beauveria bassiana ARSEF 2860]
MPPKRKRSDRPSGGETGRPSPHRPAEMVMGHHERDDGNNRGRGRTRGASGRRDSSHVHGRNGPHGQPNPQPSPTRQRQGSGPQHPSSQASRQRTASTPSSPVKPAPMHPPSESSTASARPRQQRRESQTLKPPKPSNYYFDIITDEQLANWAAAGRDHVVSRGAQARDDIDVVELSSLLQEFIHAVLAGKLSPEEAGACVKEIIGEENTEVIKDSLKFLPHTLFLDSLAIVMDNDSDLYQPILRQFLMSTGVSTALMRQILDAPILQQLGLIRDTFARLGVRQATNLLYRQANYNLLREESEGYSKLITELFTTSSVPPPPPELAQHTFERVKALIGTFDLDVGRVLDVTLDVAAAVLIKQYKFFVKFLRVSSWWPRSQVKLNSTAYSAGLPTWAHPDYSDWVTSPQDEEVNAEAKQLRDVEFWNRARDIHLAAFFELGGRQVPEQAIQTALIANAENNQDGSLDLEQQWIKETNTLPPPGNRVAAQLLGFKLRFYNSELRAEADVLPANLLYLAALLVKVGFISLIDLYPHLSPADDKMEEVREQELKKKEEEERASRGGGMNALLMAGVLPQGDDDNPNAVRKEVPKKTEAETKQAAEQAQEAKPQLPEPLEQKVSFLTQLLTIGAIPESLFILGRFPWIPETFPDVLSRIHRILNVSVDKVYNASKPTSITDITCPTKFVPDLDQTGIPKGTVKLTRLPVKKIWRWPFPDKFDTNENQTYRFYWDEWSDHIPVCQTVDDVFTLCSTFLNISGVCIGKDEVLLSKLASIGSMSLTQDGSEENLKRWHDLLKRLLLPALSHTKANAAVVNAIWDLLKLYPTTTRYALYAEWFEGQTSRLPAMRTAFARAIAETRGTMKRVSLTNLGEMAKQLAKTSYSSPGIVFRVAFEQLESYPNLIEAFVECAKYFTDLSYDVLVWSLMNSLGKSRSRTQADHALTTSKWLQALSKFTGRVFRRYSLLNAIPVLLYVNDQLFHGNSTDLIILKELMSSMGGIVDLIDFTDYQILSMAGFPSLRKHTLMRGGDKRYDNIKSSKRLIEALTESGLAARLLVNLAQYRQATIFRVPEGEAHLKFLSSVIDVSHQTLIQYLDFLWNNMEQPDFDSIVPSIPDLMQTYGLDVGLAFLIGRASLSQRVFHWNMEDPEATKGAPVQIDKDGDLAMVEKAAADDSVPELAVAIDQNQAQIAQISASLQPLTNAVKASARPEVWDKITPELATTFWALQLGDIYCPADIYKTEADRLKAEESALLRDRSDMSRRGQELRTEKRKELTQTQINLLEDRKKHVKTQANWTKYLTNLFQESFRPTAKADAISDVLLEQCILPRVLISPADTEYTFRFIKSLHDNNAPGFKLMSLYNRLFHANRLRTLIFTCSVREAEYLGRFLKLILEDLSIWHKNAPASGGKNVKNAQKALGAYETEGIGPRDNGRRGFALTLDDQGKPLTFVEHAQFRDLLFGWHKNLNSALKSCLGGSEWMHIRNALTVLKSVVDFFPAIDFMASQFSAQLQKITQQEAAQKTAPEDELGGRVDLSVAAQGALSELQRRKSKWVLVQVFRTNADVGTKTNDRAAASALRATASDFKPGVAKINASRTGEEEDGEVQDSKQKKLVAAAGGPGRDNLPARPSRGGREAGKEEVSTSGQSRSSTPKTAPKGDRGYNLPDRPNLPTRPDVPIPGHYTPERFNQSRGHERRDGREGRESREGRNQREPREGREGRESLDSRPGRNERDRQRDGASVDASKSRERERQPRNTRGGGEDEPKAPSPAPQAGQAEPMMNPQRAALFAKEENAKPPRSGPEPDRSKSRRPEQASGTDNVNPERAALLDLRDDKSSGRSSRNDGRDRDRDRSGRNQSPRHESRHGEQSTTGTPSNFDERHGRIHVADHRPPGRSRDRSPGMSGSFRNDKGADRSEAFYGAPRGLEAEKRHHSGYQDPNYGRLNPVPQGPETPSGPRPRGRGAARGGHATPTGPAVHQDSRATLSDQNLTPTTERLPPSGPASVRGWRAGYEASTPGSAPSTHDGPTRKQGGSNGEAAGAPSGMHPDRLAAIDNKSAQGPQPPPPPPPGPPPSHNRGGEGNIPTGPSAASDRHRGGRRQLAGINSALQQGSMDNMGRGSNNNNNNNSSHGRHNPSRQMLGGNSDAQVLAGGTQPSTPGQEHGRWMDAPKGPSNGDGSGRDQSRGYRDNNRERSGRSGRPRSHERDGKSGGGHGEHRDRRSMGGHGGSSEQQGPRGPGAGPDWPGHAGNNVNRGGVGRGSGGSRTDDRGHREDRGRKRRSEEGAGTAPNERGEKRARR